jgi:hypothetical protein
MQIIIGILLALGIFILGLYLGYVFALKVVAQVNNPLNSKPSKEEKKEIDSTTPEVEEMPLSSEDNINHDGVGIVQRPTSEELARFAEPQAVKDAKAAVAETLRNTPEIDSPTG